MMRSHLNEATTLADDALRDIIFAIRVDDSENEEISADLLALKSLMFKMQSSLYMGASWRADVLAAIKKAKENRV